MYFMPFLKKFAVAVALLGMISGLASAKSPEQMVAEGVAKVIPGYKFNKRLAGPGEEDHILLFSKGKDCALVTWTTGQAKQVSIPASPMNFSVFDSTGKLLSNLLAQNFNIGLVLAKEPAIYVPQADNALLQVAVLAQRMEPKITVRGPQIIDLECEFINPMNKPLILSAPGSNSVAIKPGDRHTIRKQVKVGRFAEPMRVQVGASGIYQTVTIESENPLLMDLQAEEPGRLRLTILNPLADPFSGRLALKLVGDSQPPFEFPVEMASRERIKELQIPLGIELPLPKPVNLTLVQPVGDPREDVVLARTSPTQFMPIKGLEPGADQKPQSWMLETQGKLFAQIRAGEPPQGAPWGARTAMLAYKFDQPGATMELKPANAQTAEIIDVPTEVGFWIRGDASQSLISVRWRDKTGKIYQPKPRLIDWKGWRYETFATDSSMQPPILWESLVHVQASKPASGAIMISGPVLTYQTRLTEGEENVKKSVEVKEDISYGKPVELDRSALQPGAGASGS